MSFWQADCSKLQSRSVQHDGDSSYPESSLWAALPHAADSAATDDGRMHRRMRQPSIIPGATLSLDETAAEAEQSVDCSVQQRAWHPAPDDGAGGKAAQQRQQLPAEDLLLPQLSSFTPYSTAEDGPLQSVQCSYDGAGYAIEQQERLPRVTPPASPARSEETVGFAPAAAKASCTQAPAASEDPTDISSHYRATKRRRLAGVSATESQPRVQRALDLTDDAESNMPPPAPQERPQRRGQLQRTSCVSRASHHEGMPARSQRNMLAADRDTIHQDESPDWGESFHPLPHPLDPEE